MYPRGELIALERRKVWLRGRIARHRWQCRQAAGSLARPLDWLDRALAQWRRISPFLKLAAVPLGLIFKRSLFPRVRIFSSLLRWAPVAFSALRSFRA